MKECTKISDLPAWLRVKAKTNIALNKRRGGSNTDRKCDFVESAFWWSPTPEGQEFWHKISWGEIPEKPNGNNG